MLDSLRFGGDARRRVKRIFTKGKRPVDTIRVDICYRPLRIGWAIRSGDIEAFRSAVRLTYALWGGRFNPILNVDREEEARQLVDLFRVDLIWPIGGQDEVKAFPKKFPYLIAPFFHDKLFAGGSTERKHAQVLDIHNALVHLADRPEWKAVKDRGVRLYSWQPDDPLADVFLVLFGAYPSAAETGVDYRWMVAQVAQAAEHTLPSDGVIPADASDHPGIAYISRLGVERHYAIPARHDSPGFFLGSASNVDDLVAHWNLRAADIPVWFVDPKYLPRYAQMIPAWETAMRAFVARRRHEWDRDLAVWSRRDDINEAAKVFGDMTLLRCPVAESLWNGRNLQVPMMHLGQASVLGAVGRQGGKPKVSFPLGDKPFAGDVAFYSQQLVASVSFIGGLSEDDHTLDPPLIPELNEFYARSMHFEYNKLRVEPERVGVVIDAADHDSFLYALPVADLMGRLFGLVGYTAKLSSGGLIARQLIARLGGLQGCRVFKIPGVRRLLRTHGPTATFTMQSALQLIGSKDPDNPNATFADYEDLHIEARPAGATLTPASVFGYLVENGIFRIGADVTCPSCRMVSWTALDSLKQRVVCELCGNEHDATRQLVGAEWHYRRSGLLGLEKNAQGAIPVVLTLQQLEANIHGGPFERTYSTSLNLEPKEGVDRPKCEIDFVWIDKRPVAGRTVIILGECKDRGPIKLPEFEKDVENLRRVADALPQERIETFILLAKLAPFTPEEIERARSLNGKYSKRVILLTARELEPYFMYERTKAEFNIEGYAGTAEDLAQATSEIYFRGKVASA